MRRRVITSRSNPAVKRLRSLTHSHARRKSDTFLIDGPKFVLDAAGAGVDILTLAVSEKYRGPLPQTGSGTRLVCISEQLFKEISDTASPQGLIAEVKRRWSKLSKLTATRRHLLAAWGVQDPGNTGTMIRSSAAFGMGGLIVSRDSADPFSPKAVRASAGAVLRHSLARATELGKLVHTLRKAGYSTYWTGMQGELSLREVPRGGLFAVFIGSEGHGFLERDRRTIGAGIRVPTGSQVESLNAGVAGSIVAYELSVQVRKNLRLT